MNRAKYKPALIGALAALLVLLPLLIWKATRSSSQSDSAGDILRTFTGPQGRKVIEKISGDPLPWDANNQGRFISASLVEPSGKVWIGTEEGGLWSCDPAAKSWSHFTREQGLGDDSICALALDTQGRIWAGHLHSGVSVYDGKSWKNFGPLDGPLAQRVYDIAVSPATARFNPGDVWIAGDMGLTRYIPATDEWQYFRANNIVPHDRVSSIAFDSLGDIYLGLQNDGVAMGQSGGNFQVWQRAYGIDETPAAGTGKGFHNRAVNDILVVPGEDQQNIVFAATTRGLMRSADSGRTWTFHRGADWEAKVSKSIYGPPSGFKRGSGGAILLEDFITCLAEDENGLLWLGYRTKGFQCIDPKSMKSLLTSGGTTGPAGIDYCSTITPRPGEAPLLATTGAGLKQSSHFFAPASPTTRPVVAAASSTAFPSPAKAPTVQQLRESIEGVRIFAQGLSTPVADYLGEDWATRGDWVGRYGREQAFWPSYGALAKTITGYALRVHPGPHRTKNAGGVYHYYASKNAASPNSLYFPQSGTRQQGEWNDGGWQEQLYGPNFEGPDLWFDVTVPAGVHRVSLYIYNNDGEGKIQRRRDYPIELKAYTESIDEAQKAPALARTRFLASRHPIYKSFALSEGRYWIRVASNYSNCVKVSAVFFDRLGAPLPGDTDATSEYVDGEVSFVPAPPIPAPAANESESLKEARALWNELDAQAAHAGTAPLQVPYRLLAYRAAAAAGAPEELLFHWRTALHLWTQQDRDQWNNAMEESRKSN